MADLVLFHHALGLTAGVHAFADRLRAGGHTVETPDLFDGATFDSIEAGVAHAESIGFVEISAIGAAATAERPQGFAVGGFSLGVLPAMRIAQTQPGVAGAVLYHGGVPLGTFAESWPDDVGLQLHVCSDDDWGDVPDVRELAAAVPGAELHEYPGAAHLVTDSSWQEYDPTITAQIVDRTLAFLAAG